ncbi:MAG: HipA domain-containing protein [Acidimicrobiaceae bacterium]|nr:HipA domain-containing protein [Acidimicrobiaceae bacterium]
MAALSVVMAGRFAGVAAADGSAGASRVGFEYDADYLASPDATPLSVSLQQGRHEVGVWLDGLLSDNHLVRERWQVEHRIPTTRAIDLLASPVGRDCAGAVQFCPEEDTEAMLARGGGVRELSQRRVAWMIDRLREDEAAWSHGETDAAFSLGGAQAKTALRYDGNRWWLPHDASPTTHILKPGVGRFPDTDIIEHISQRAAALVGIHSVDTECITVRGERALLVTRYDRRPTASDYQRIHQEDICQALGVPVTRKYQEDGGPDVARVAGLLWSQSSDPETDVRLFRDALIWNWIIAGPDAHAKNYGLLLDRNEVRLAPLYDICSVLPYRHLIDPPEVVPVSKLKLAMKIGRDYSIHKADYRAAWERTSDALGLPRQETLDRAEELARQTNSAVEQAIDELPQKLRSSRYVSLMAKEIEQRAPHCAYLSHMATPTRHSKVTPVGGQAPPVSPRQGTSRPVTRKHCTHHGEHSHKQCILSEEHKPPHRYR